MDPLLENPEREPMLKGTLTRSQRRQKQGARNERGSQSERTGSWQENAIAERKRMRSLRDRRTARRGREVELLHLQRFDERYRSLDGNRFYRRGEQRRTIDLDLRE